MTTTTRPVPRWAEWTAHAVPLAVLPSGLWRIALGLGVPVGFSGSMAELYHAPDPVLTPYVFALSLVSEFFALLTLGLVRPWGEVFPRWMPLVGGRNVPVWLAVGLATTGAVAVTLIGWSMMGQWTGNMASPEAPQGLAGVVMFACYAPFLLWGPLLVAVTVHYAVRRTRGAGRALTALR
ncbi:hypothetical protein [Actinomadura kijaniata]|uniref:hypothetical protein n=1 Tax=Actinomadura kijaniata TaxID=46161 RepID=UPI000831E706|nr:hypothetical protein [Actinomadura kijaniata]